MNERNKGSIIWLLLATISFTIALLAVFGVILSNDGVGRLIYGVLWSMIGLSWMGRFFIARNKTE